MKTKEEAIRDAWGEYWYSLSEAAKKCSIDHNGFISPIISGLGLIPRDFVVFYDMGFRPKSLQGIENNNGWTNSLDKQPNFCQSVHVYSKEFGVQQIVKGDHDIKQSHWQPIITPKPPIY